MPLVYPKKSRFSGRYRLENGKPVPSVTEVLKDVGLTPSFKGISPAVLNAKGQIGTAVHDQIDRLFKGEDYDYTDMGSRAVRLFESFLTFIEKMDLVPISTEKKMITSRVAGTRDLFCLMNGEPWILDWKNRAKQPQPYDCLQLTGYFALSREIEPDVVPKDVRMGIVTLRESDGMPTLVPFEKDLPTWYGAVAVWWARTNWGMWDDD
jgi:hypothetical protein